MALDEIKADRLKKLETIKQLGVDPYPAKAERSHTAVEALEEFDPNTENNKLINLVGRIRSIRTFGKIAFVNIEDESGKIQLFFSEEILETSNKPFDMKFLELLDIGDFIEANGYISKTKTDQTALFVKNYRLLTKSMLPLPVDHFGLKDDEERLRRRYLDLVMNPDLREMFRTKSKFWASVRNYLLSKGGLEVETPVLQATAGGADARPFITHHNAQDMELYLRISPELYLKRLLVGGFEKVFEIGRIFRNEGIDDEHLQDYTQMEMYWAYMDYAELMDFVEDMTKTIIQETFGALKTTWKGHEIDWSGKWPIKDYTDLLNESWGVDIDQMSVEDLYQLADKLGVKVEPNLGKGRLLDYIYKKTIRPKLIQPMFVINHPVEVEPLAKRLDPSSNKVQRMQILAMGSELGKGFSELNDPIDQRERFEDQMKLREAGDDEAQMMDEDFVEALEYGMPPASGFAYSERLFSMLVDKPIREMVFFPTMKPEIK